jgi:CBS domain-containing protein
MPDDDATAASAADPTIADIMERDVVTIGPDATVHELVTLLQKRDLGGVPVVDGEDHLLGMITEGDLVIEGADVRAPHYLEILGVLVPTGGKKKFDEQIKKMVGNKVSEVMTTDVMSVAPGDPVSHAANIMVDHNVDRVPVVEDERLVGIVARHDIIKMLGL